LHGHPALFVGVRQPRRVGVPHVTMSAAGGSDTTTAAVPSAEALQRKARSEAALRDAEVPVLESLGVIASSADAHRRSLDEVILRLLVLGRVQGLASARAEVRLGMADDVRTEMRDTHPELWEAASKVCWCVGVLMLVVACACHWWC